jgi:hypothetical protein
MVAMFRFGSRPLLGVLSLTATVLLALPTAATAAPASSLARSSGAAPRAGLTINATLVWVRVEGATRTIFEAPVITTGHTVTTASGGTHHCDGTNNGANPAPVPTATSALDNAATAGGFTWDGAFFAAFDDYLISRIAETSQTDTQFWGIFRNDVLIPVGGCQQRVQFGDRVLFAFDAFNKSHVLKLSGPPAAVAGHPITVRVTDAASGAPIAGATVAGQSTAPDGTATVTLTTLGFNRLKAERADSIRSNSLPVFVG